MGADQASAGSVPADHEAWRTARWDEVAGPDGKAKVVARGMVSGREPQVVEGVPGRWSTTEGGAPTVTAAAADGVRVEGETVDGTVEVPAGSPIEFPGGRTGFAGGADGAYGLVVMDQEAIARSGLTGIDAYPYDPAWVFRGEYRAAAEGRRIEVGRLTVPRSTEAISAPVDLVVTIGGTEYVLAVLEDMPGQRLVVFTDETNGSGTPEIGRWLVLPLLEPGSTLTVDFNRATLSHHHLVPAVFTCPLAPPGNHLPLRVEAGERALTYATPPAGGSGAMSSAMSQHVEERAIAYLRHLENREWADARAMCSETATVWHNDGNGDSTIDENIAGMAAQIEPIASMRYEITRQFSRPDEVLQQHVVHVVTTDGARFRVDAAVYFRFEDGQIARIEEYASLPGGNGA
jgi:uncharacterized protein (DUF1684 family)/ketosteroid isomerase-like protein